MTSPDPQSTHHTKVVISCGDYPPEVPADASGASGHRLWVVPNTLAMNDPHARAVRDGLRQLGIQARVLAPRTPASALVRSHRSWIRVRAEDWSGRIDSRLIEHRLHGVVTIAPALRKGPFPLDLPAHFLHPMDRLRLLASRERSRQVVSLASQVPAAGWTMATRVEGATLWVRTNDVVAAELWALALAEQFFDPSLDMSGPWEDPTVQRATELDLGIRVPADIEVVLDATKVLPAPAIELVSRVCRRLGVALSGDH